MWLLTIIVRSKLTNFVDQRSDFLFSTLTMIAISVFVSSCSGSSSGEQSNNVVDDPDVQDISGSPTVILNCQDLKDPFVVFVAQKTNQYQYELYRTSPMGNKIFRLSSDIQYAGDVRLFQISPNNKYVAYMADQDTDEKFELFVACTDGSAVSKISGAMVGDIQDFQWSPDSTHIAYRADQDRADQYELYVSRVIDGENIKLSGDMMAGSYVGAAIRQNGKGDDNSYRWAPDSTAVAYTANVESRYYFDLYVSNIDGSRNEKVSRNLTQRFGVYPDFIWSPDGKYIAYRVHHHIGPNLGDYTLELYSTAVNGSSHIKVSGPMVKDGHIEMAIASTAFYSPNYTFKWAPDSSRIAYVADQDTDEKFELYTTSPITGDYATVSNLAVVGNYVYGFLWHEDSTQILYNASQGYPSRINVFVTDTDGIMNTQITDIETGASGYWAPDYSKIVYSNYVGNGPSAERYLSSLDGNSVQKIIWPEPGYQFHFISWSPDGTKIAYTVRLENNVVPEELYVAELDGNGGVKINSIFSKSGIAISNLFWTSDSQHVIYRSDQNEPYRQELYSSSVNIGESSNINISGEFRKPGGGVGAVQVSN